MVGCTVNQLLGSYLSTILALGGNGTITLNVSSSAKELVVGNGIDLFPCLCYEWGFYILLVLTWHWFLTLAGHVLRWLCILCQENLRITGISVIITLCFNCRVFYLWVLIETWLSWLLSTSDKKYLSHVQMLDSFMSWLNEDCTTLGCKLGLLAQVCLEADA